MSVRKISPEQMRNALFDIQRWWAGEEDGTSRRNIRAERWGRAAGNGGIPVNFAHVDDRKTAAWSAWGHSQRVEPRLGRIDNKHRKFNKWKLAGAPQFRYMGWQLTRHEEGMTKYENYLCGYGGGGLLSRSGDGGGGRADDKKPRGY